LELACLSLSCARIANDRRKKRQRRRIWPGRQWLSSGRDMGQRQYLSRRMAEVMKRPKPLHEALD
jgi:hypothetical protein